MAGSCSCLRGGTSWAAAALVSGGTVGRGAQGRSFYDWFVTVI